MGKQYGDEVFIGVNTTGMLKERVQARAVKRVLDRRSLEIVGWLYRWNTGHLAVMWKDEKQEDVIYE